MPVGREKKRKPNATSINANVSVALTFDIKYNPNAPPTYPIATPIPDENALFFSSDTDGKREL
jgi:hypothetical protein